MNSNCLHGLSRLHRDQMFLHWRTHCSRERVERERDGRRDRHRCGTAVSTGCLSDVLDEATLPPCEQPRMNEVVREPREAAAAGVVGSERGKGRHECLLILIVVGNRMQLAAANRERERERERPPLSGSGGSLASPRGWGACPTAEGGRRDQETDRPTDGVGDSGGWDWEEDGQQVLSPSLLHQRPRASVLHPSYGAVTSARTLARIMEAERAGAGRGRESGPLGWGATYVSQYSPLSSIFCLFASVYMAPFLD